MSKEIRDEKACSQIVTAHVTAMTVVTARLRQTLCCGHDRDKLSQFTYKILFSVSGVFIK